MEWIILVYKEAEIHILQFQFLRLIENWVHKIYFTLLKIEVSWILLHS